MLMAFFATTSSVFSCLIIVVGQHRARLPHIRRKD